MICPATTPLTATKHRHVIYMRARLHDVRNAIFASNWEKARWTAWFVGNQLLTGPLHPHAARKLADRLDSMFCGVGRRYITIASVASDCSHSNK